MRLKYESSTYELPDFPEGEVSDADLVPYIQKGDFNLQSRLLGQFATGRKSNGPLIPLGQLFRDVIPVEDDQTRVEIICRHPGTGSLLFPDGILPAIYTDIPRAYADAAFGWLSQKLGIESFLFFAVPAKFWVWDHSLQTLIRNFVVYTTPEAELERASEAPGWQALAAVEQNRPERHAWLESILSGL